MSKSKIVEDIMMLTPIPKDSLNRMTIYDLNTLLHSLKGDVISQPKIEEDKIPHKPIKRENKNKRNVKRVIKDEDEEPKENEEIVEENDPFEEPIDNNIENEVIEEVVEVKPQPKAKPKSKAKPKPKPKKASQGGKTPPKPKPKKVKVVPEPESEENDDDDDDDDDDETEEEEENIFKEPEIPKPSKLKRNKKTKIVNERTECKEILIDFRKETSKLIQQYKRVRNPKDYHKDKLIEYYNDLYDKTCECINQVLDNYKFIDDSVYEYCNDLTEKEKTRIERLIGS